MNISFIVVNFDSQKSFGKTEWICEQQVQIESSG